MYKVIHFSRMHATKPEVLGKELRILRVFLTNYFQKVSAMSQSSLLYYYIQIFYTHTSYILCPFFIICLIDLLRVRVRLYSLIQTTNFAQWQTGIFLNFVVAIFRTVSLRCYCYIHPRVKQADAMCAHL